MVWKAALGLFAVCYATTASAQTLREQIDAEKAVMSKDVDQSVLAVLQQPGRDWSGVSLAQARQAGFWLVMAPPIGICYDNGGSEVYVAWLSAAELTGPESSSTRSKGVETVMEMKQQNLLAKATAARRAAFCKVRIMAVKETLAERFGVR